MGYDELLNVCESLDVDMSEESAQLVEKETRLQHNSKLWFKYRAGRICHTDASNPSQSLVKSGQKIKLFKSDVHYGQPL